MMTIEEITKQNLILCEGGDEKVFLIELMKFYEKKEDYGFLESFQVINFGGNEQLKSFLPVLMLSSGFSKVKTVTVVRDAEKDGAGALQSVQSVLKNNALPVPQNVYEVSVSDNGIKTGIMLFPCTVQRKNGVPVPDNGTLEDLCFNIVKASQNDPADLKIRSAEFVDSINHARKHPLKRSHKNRIHVFLSSTDECVDAKVGEAVKRNAYDLDAPVIHKMIDFLRLIGE